jgi:outer membrane protein assembly factor BamA
MLAMNRWLICFLFLLSFPLVYAQEKTPKDSSAKKVSTLLFPVIGRAPETNWVFGAAGVLVFKTKPSDSLLRSSTIPFGIIYSLKHQITISNGVNIYFPGEKYIFRLENTFTKFPDRFWGIGYNTPNSNMETYTYSQLFINPQFLKKIYKNFFVGICAEYQNVFYINYTSGGLFDRENIAGRNGSKSVGLGLELSMDSRNNTFSPTKGYLVKLLTVVFNKALTSGYNYSYTELDVRRYISHNKNNNVFAFQVAGIFTVGDVPFRSLAVLGGPNIMRGYYGGRYRDKNVLAFQIEERMHLWWRFGIVAFAGLGQVSENYTDWHLNNIKYSVGAGIRFAVLPKEKVNIRIDYGIGYKAQNVYLTVTEAF